MYGCEKSEVTQSCPTLCDPMDTRLLHPWDFLVKSTGVGCCFLLQGTSRPRGRTQVSLIVDRHLRYADDTTLMAESEEELKCLLIKVKVESEKGGLKLNIQKMKTKIMASGPITSWEIDGETVETMADYFGGLQNHCRW